ncbi:DUF2155 domain-containing protein [Acidiphilium sp. AL]|uniref:DUF2155 domain-containing protein n=1 Tax=Acidiphilium iwatense TaxID=768198 RepID=A0ABS9DYB3_9PROT|nr:MULTISPECIES: DUF2155 domain-containing protein [Acidiphilium]MCF3947738.1 DUF2155 domain-containing protein [Acidiphilium iwatense]MCU4160093.1 DUF2155 domain-containing protein [Acidiphilium sp. AL]
MIGRIAIAVAIGTIGAIGLARAGSPQVLAVPEAPPVASVPQALPAPDLPSPQVPALTLAQPPGLVRNPLPKSMIQRGTSGTAPGAAGGNGQTQAVQAKPVWMPRDGAILDMLDKEDGAVTRLSVPVGSSFARGKLRIKVGACVVRPKDAPPDAAVYLTVRRIAGPASNDAQNTATSDAAPDSPLFRGWLIRSEPGAVVVGDATVTFRVIGCSGG